ncbi:MAG: 5-histidylcysteine sulfoxide synthase [Planctomycetota bacterium]
MRLTRNPNLSRAAHELPRGEELLVPWTGLPAERCPGIQPDGTLSSLPLPDLASCTREQVQAYFDNGWTLTEVLFRALRAPEAFYTAPYHQLRHPLVFYAGHPPALYVNKLQVAGLATSLDPDLETLFETGVDEMSWDDMSKNEMEWPPLERVLDYRRQVYRTVSELIASHPDLAPGHAPIGWDSPLWALFLGFEHERIHLETTSVLIRELPVEWLRRPSQWPQDAPAAPARQGAFPPLAGEHFPRNPLVEVAGGAVALGKPREWPSYGWDNEYGRDERRTGPFAITRNLISNGELHAFVAAGGYQKRRYWSETGWSWRGFRNVKWPTFWVSDGPAGLHRYRLRTTFAVVEMPWDWPAVVNAHEARAYAAWRAERDGVPYRLPTEAEHAWLRGPLERDPVMQETGVGLRARGLNLNLAWGSEGPVDGDAPGPRGVTVAGNLWRWLEDDFHPLPGARVHPYYDDFSTPCYDGEHTMILGGSFASTGDEASAWARFHFRPHFFQHAGFQLVRDDGPGAVVRLGGAGGAGQEKYEQGAVLAAYLELHYGSPAEAMPFEVGPRHAAEFPRRCGALLLEAAAELGLRPRRALDLGCGLGGASFELARACEEVLGVDLSAAFVESCQRLAAAGELAYQAPDEGELREPRVARVPAEIDRARVSFRRADAQALPPELEGFDLVLAANLVDRLPSPGACLRRMAGPRGLVAPGGLLLVTSPYTWLSQFTPREVWLGGRLRDGQPLRSQDGLGEALGEEFELLRALDLPLLIREHRRKYELVISQGTLWRRRG